MCVVKVGRAGLKRGLKWIAERTARALAGADIRDASICRKGDVHRFGVGVIGEKRQVLEDSLGAAAGSLFNVNLKCVEIGHAIVLVFKDVAEWLKRPAGLCSNAYGPRV